MAEAAALVIRARASFNPVLTRFRPPLGRTVDRFQFLGAMGKLTLFAIRTVATSAHVGCTQFCFIKLSVSAGTAAFFLRTRGVGRVGRSSIARGPVTHRNGFSRRYREARRLCAAGRRRAAAINARRTGNHWSSNRRNSRRAHGAMGLAGRSSHARNNAAI